MTQSMKPNEEFRQLLDRYLAGDLSEAEENQLHLVAESNPDFGAEWRKAANFEKLLTSEFAGLEQNEMARQKAKGFAAIEKNEKAKTLRVFGMTPVFGLLASCLLITVVLAYQSLGNGRIDFSSGVDSKANERLAGFFSVKEKPQDSGGGKIKNHDMQLMHISDPKSGSLTPSELGGQAPIGNHFNGMVGPHGDPICAEKYGTLVEGEFRSVKDAPRSTFSVDVDTASYSNIRRYLNGGQLPPSDAVRIEEMLNYFKFDYKTPGDDHPLALHLEAANCPWQPQHKLMLVGLKGKEVAFNSLPDRNFVFLVDSSGSMNHQNKLPLVKESLKLLLEQLGAEDNISLVTYAGNSRVVLESTPASEKLKIQNAIDSLGAGGGTNGSGGLVAAYDQAMKNFKENGINRVVLCTDGDFNVGVADGGGLTKLVEEKRNLGVFVTVMGFGCGNINDHFMEVIADKGNGNYFYIDGIREARKVLLEDLAQTVGVVARDVKLQLEFNPAEVKAWRLIGYENRLLNDEDFKDAKKDAAEMGPGQCVTALYQIVPVGVDCEIPDSSPLKYQDPGLPSKEAKNGELFTAAVAYKKPGRDETVIDFNQALKNENIGLRKASDNMKFAAAVAAFGLMLRDSKFKGQCCFEGINELLGEVKLADPNGFRAEFSELVKKAEQLFKVKEEADKPKNGRWLE